LTLLINSNKNCLILKDQLKTQEAEYEQKYQSLSFELSQFKENILSDNERFGEYEAKLKELECEIEILKKERNTFLKNLNNEQEKNTNLLEELKNFKNNLDLSNNELQYNRQNNEKIVEEYQVSEYVHSMI
jgi:chromosome segregation ATPase